MKREEDKVEFCFARGRDHCLFKFDVQFTTKVRGVFFKLTVFITNFFPSGVTS